MPVIPATALDNGLANLSDLPEVKANYDLGTRSDNGFAIFFPEPQEVDLVRFFLDLSEEFKYDLFDSMWIDRPSYRGNWYVFEGWEIDGTSLYEEKDD